MYAAFLIYIYIYIYIYMAVSRLSCVLKAHSHSRQVYFIVEVLATRVSGLPAGIDVRACPGQAVLA